MDDLVHDTFMRAHRRGSTTLEGLRWMARRVHLNYVRAQAAQPEAVPDEVLARIPAVGEDAWLFTRALDRALRGLPEGQRSAFILTELRGASAEEAAGLLGTTAGAVRERVRQARSGICPILV